MKYWFKINDSKKIMFSPVFLNSKLHLSLHLTRQLYLRQAEFASLFN